MSDTPNDAAFLLGAALISSESGLAEPVRDCRIAVSDDLRARIVGQKRAVVISSRGQSGVYAELPQGVSACLVLPWYSRDTLTHHVVLFVGGGIGTLEVWAPEDPGIQSGALQLRLASGYFGDLPEFFRLTSVTSFHWDEGLPGQAAARRGVIVFGDLAESTAFLRASAAQSVGLKCGFAFPVYHPTGMDVATILLGDYDAHRTRIDAWYAESQGPRSREADPEFEAHPAHEIVTRTAEHVSRTGCPTVVDGPARSDDGRSQNAFGWIGNASASVPHILTVAI